MARQGRRRALRGILANLPTQCARVMAFVYVMGVPRRTVAKQLGISKKAVDKQVARGKRILRRRMDSVEMERWVSSFEDGGGVDGFLRLPREGARPRSAPGSTQCWHC